MFAKSILAGSAVLALTVAPAFSATVTVYSDDFNRANGAVGNGWQISSSTSTVSIDSNSMLFTGAKNADVSATQGTQTISTVGFTNITLSFQWEDGPTGKTEGGDKLDVSWSSNGTTFTSIANLNAGNSSFTSVGPLALGAGAANLADLTIRISFSSNGNDGSARLDDLVISGDTVQSGNGDPLANPLPAALPMFLGGAGLIALLARRRNQKRPG
jgi:hypothetical protein